jgi:hypothetical protein
MMFASEYSPIAPDSARQLSLNLLFHVTFPPHIQPLTLQGTRPASLNFKTEIFGFRSLGQFHAMRGMNVPEKMPISY